MQCLNPRLAFRSLDNTRIKFTGLAWSTYITQSSTHTQLKPKYNTLFSKIKNIDLTQPLKIPCSKCEHCDLNRAHDTATRVFHEYKHPSPPLPSRGRKPGATSPSAIGGPGEVATAPPAHTGMFLTLTYSDEHLPPCGHFEEKHIVQFVKDLRKMIAPATIRTLGVAEYGERTKRAHFHLLIIGYVFSDKKHLRKTDSTHTGHNYDIFTSLTLQQLWDKGMTEFGSITEQSCGYVARYMHKKNKQRSKGKPCANCQNQTPLKPKIVCRSRRPGLGANFCDLYITHERLRANANRDIPQSLPRYYIDRVRKKLTEHDRLLLTPQPDYERNRDNERKERLQALKIITQQKLLNLKRNKI